MKKITLGFLASLLLASPLFAVPLTWKFSGAASTASVFNGGSIAGLGFEIRISLDTDLVAVNPMALADVFFFGPHAGEVEIQTLGVKPLNPFSNVQYFAPGGLVTGVQFNQPAFNDIFFPASISSDSLHLTPIPPTTPSVVNNTLQSGVIGPGGLFLSGVVNSFSAVTTPTPEPVPETGATLALLACSVSAVCLLRRVRGRGKVRRSH